jgi:hypothetical protein
VPDIRTFLDLSTAHLPEQICDQLSTQPGVIAYQTVYGRLMWVPEHPGDPAERAGIEIPEVVLVIQRFARAAGCDYVLFDAVSRQSSRDKHRKRSRKGTSDEGR